MTLKATAVLMSYDERPTLVAVRSLLRDVTMFPGELAVWDQSKDALIPRTRSAAASRFLEQGFGDVLVMIDQDIEWAEGDLAFLVQACEQEKAIVGGVYSQRQFGRGYALRLWPDTPPLRLGTEGIADVEYVGTGFMAIHRRALEKLALVIPRTRHGYHPFFALDYPWTNGQVEELSEDFAFSKRAREMAGVRTFAAMKPNLVHWGSYGYRQFDASWTPPAPQTVTLHPVDPDEATDVPNIGRFILDPEDRFIAATLRRGEEWEPGVMRELERLSRQSKTLVEAGANIGAHTVPAARLFKKVIAVEPLFADRLRRNLQLNGLDGVRVVEAAVNGTAGKAFMQRDFTNPGASKLADYGVPVDVVSLADVLPARGRCVLKLDIEGAEFGALKNAPLDRVKAMILEYSEAQLAQVSKATADDLMAVLDGAGFTSRRYAGTEVEVTKDNLPRGAAYCNLVAERG
jgi:FkbM family methyltransferase